MEPLTEAPTCPPWNSATPYRVTRAVLVSETEPGGPLQFARREGDGLITTGHAHIEGGVLVLDPFFLAWTWEGESDAFEAAVREARPWTHTRRFAYEPEGDGERVPLRVGSGEEAGATMARG